MDINYLKKLKKMRGITFQQIADKSGIPKRTVEEIFAERTKHPRIDTWKAIYEVLELPQNDVPRETDPNLLKPVKLNISRGAIERASGVHPELSEEEKQLISLISQLTEEEVKELSSFVDYIVSKRS